MQNNKVTGVIIARKGSKRLPGKMYKNFNGTPLIKLKINQLLKSNVDEIAVGSDDLKLKKICDSYKNKKIKFFLREKKYCDEISTTPNEMVKNMVSFLSNDIIVWCHPTNPLTTNKHIDESIRIFKKEEKKGKDSLYAVSALNDYFWDHKKKPINHNPLEKTHTLLKKHKIKYIYVDNGAIYIRRRNDWLKDGRFWGRKGHMYIMKETDGWDINTLWDLESCQLKSFKKNLF